MEQELRRLPDGELEVMQALWHCRCPAERKDIEAELKRPLAVTTLLTLLTRLSEKGFLRIEKAGRGSVYTPLVEQHAYLSAQSGRFIQKICGGNLSAFASALCDSGLSREELAELQALLRENSL